MIDVQKYVWNENGNKIDERKKKLKIFEQI